MCHSVSMHLNLIYQQRACVYPPPPCPDLHHLHPHSPVAGTLLCEDAAAKCCSLCGGALATAFRCLVLFGFIT